MRHCVLTLVVAACGSTPAADSTIAPISTATLPVSGQVNVVTAGELGYVFDANSVAIVRGTAIVARASTPRKGTPWTAAAALRAPDGQRWVIGIADGALWRVTSAGEIEPASVRLGVTDARALSIDALGDSWVIGLTGGFAFSPDGTRVRRFAGADASQVAISTDRIAVASKGAVDVYDLAGGSRVTYRTAFGTIAFLGAHTQRAPLVVRNGGAVYVERSGLLHRVPAPDKLREIAVAGTRLWMLGKTALFLLEGDALARAKLDVANAHIHPSANGDVWLAQPKRVARYTLEVSALRAWEHEIAPVFARGCAKCHRADGEAQLDLSTAASWMNHREALQDVLIQGEMPPAGHALPEGDRRTLLNWLER